jgi:hypothetical protein
LAKILTKKNKSWMESLSLHMVYWLGTAMASTEDFIELALWWTHLHIQGIAGSLEAGANFEKSIYDWIPKLGSAWLSCEVIAWFQRSSYSIPKIAFFLTHHGNHMVIVRAILRGLFTLGCCDHDYTHCTVSNRDHSRLMDAVGIVALHCI